MARLIDADLMAAEETGAFISAQAQITDTATRRVNEVVHKKIQMLLADAPTVEIDRPTRSQFKRMAVQLGYEPVIHCRECKHYRNHPNGLCYAHTEPDDNERGYKGETVCVEPEDFCSYGERKNDFVDDNKIGEGRADER